jgi:hypothetical protein
VQNPPPGYPRVSPYLLYQDADAGELEMSPAGDGRFTATDPEGHEWVLAQRVE